MKVLTVEAICNRKNNAMSWDDAQPDMFFYDIHLKFDNTTNYLLVYGSSKGGRSASSLGNQLLDATFTLLDTPSAIESVIERLKSKCEGFPINDTLFSVAEEFLARELANIEFEFSDRDKARLKDPSERRRYGYDGPEY